MKCRLRYFLLSVLRNTAQLPIISSVSRNDISPLISQLINSCRQFIASSVTALLDDARVTNMVSNISRST